MAAKEEEEEDISSTDDELPSEPFANNDDDIPSEPFSEATASLNDEEEAVRDLYASKERLKHIVRKSGLPRLVDGFLQLD